MSGSRTSTLPGKSASPECHNPAGWGWARFLDTAVKVAFLVAVAVLVWETYFARKNPGDPPLPGAPVSIDGVALRGTGSAPITIIEFSDPLCPYCRHYVREVLPALTVLYVETGRVQLALRHVTSPAQPMGMLAAQAIECAGDQGRLWEYRDRIFRRRSQLLRAELEAQAAGLALSVGEFSACLDGAKVTRIAADLAEADAQGVTATPTFFVGTTGLNRQVSVKVVLRGVNTVEAFEAAIVKARTMGQPAVRGMRPLVLSRPWRELLPMGSENSPGMRRHEDGVAGLN